MVCRLLYGAVSRGQGPSKRCRRRTAVALLAVTAGLDRLADGRTVPALGTRRRLQALVALGWSMTSMAHRLGVEPFNLTRTMTADGVTAGTARTATVLYEQLWNTRPVEDTPARLRSAARARNHAARHGWAPPLAWDDDTIDDPGAVPDGVRLVDGRGRVDLDEVELLESAGCDRDEVARRLGVSTSAVEQARYRARRVAS